MPKTVEIPPSIVAFLAVMGDQRERPGNASRVADVCAAIGVAERTLRLHCLKHLGMSPHRYLWLRRMNRARDVLATADPMATSVTEVAGNCGFTELGRFSVAYRNLFGESPSATLRKRELALCDTEMTGA
jgi:transcriptional regulator GlxA family with amidase domain